MAPGPESGGGGVVDQGFQDLMHTPPSGQRRGDCHLLRLVWRRHRAGVQPLPGKDF